MASVARLPFAEVDASRLSGLTAQKNCQNAVTEMLKAGGSTDKPMASSNFTFSAKRPHTPLPDSDTLDLENIDPAQVSTKRSKAADGTVKPVFNLVPSASDALSKHFSATGKSFLQSSSSSLAKTDKFAFGSLPSGSSFGAAGRTAKPKRVGVLSSNRQSKSSSVRRVDPPRLGGVKKSTNAGLPFSIDAALTGTLSTYATPAAPKPKTHMPSAWFFDIHEDTADEEAANIMEHSTGILDISSDDEAGPNKRDNDRGKENVPPPDHEAVSAANGINLSDITASIKSRRSAHADDMVDEGQDRAPLGALPTDSFYGNGLDAMSVQLVSGDHDGEHSSDQVKKPLDCSHKALLDQTPLDTASEELVASAKAEDLAPVVVHEDETALAPSTLSGI